MVRKDLHWLENIRTCLIWLHLIFDVMYEEISAGTLRDSNIQLRAGVLTFPSH
jgi:hypothetical protein